MRRLIACCMVATVTLSGVAAAALTPGRTVPNPAAVTALSVTDRSVVFAVGRTRASCGSVRLWDTATRGLWTFGERTIVGCEENPSGGFGIGQVSTSGRRAFWVTHIGGNFTDYQLWTATPTARSPRRLAFATGESGDRPAILLGAGTRQAVPYAIGSTVTLVGDSGARLFRTTLEAPVEILTAGPSAGGNRVLAALADDRVVLLSSDGTVIRTDEVAPGPVTAIALALTGPVVQVGRIVTVGSASGGTRVTLPAGARMIDYRQRAIVYRLGSQVRMRHVGTGADGLLQVIQVKPWQAMPFSTDSWGSAWAKGAAVSWRSGPLD